MGQPSEQFQAQQMMRQEALNVAYQEQPLKAEIKVSPDLGDQIYVFLRSMAPDWVLLSFMTIGAVTIGLITFKKPLSGLLQFWATILKGDKK